MTKNGEKIGQAHRLARVLMSCLPGRPAVPQAMSRQHATIGIVLALALSVVACSGDDPDEGGIIGTGVVLQGAVSESSFAANSTVKAKSSDGQITELVVDASSRYSTTALLGDAPWVLSVGTSSDRTVYGIAYSDGTSNINHFSDLSLRNWFARQALDLDAEFASAEKFNELPSATDYADAVSGVFGLIAPVLASYDVNGEDTISADYASNDTGVDAFLNRNTVLIENDRVSFVLTDPASRTQSVTSSTLVLGSNFRDNGAIAPTVPGSVRALGSASDEIVLVWEPSTDDIAVLEYQVVRDGALIATTPYPVYIDSGLTVVQPYSYEIIAIDGAGNASSSSLAKIASPLLTGDAVTPAAPSLLVNLAASASSIRLVWAHDNISNVVSFKLYRGSNAQTLTPLLQTSSNIATDTAVQANATYCYQVTAIGASGIESERSDVLCINASDIGGTGAATDAPLVEWIVPDVDALNCANTLTSAQLTQGITVIDAGCYSVPETVAIGAGATLTITEGVVLKFAEKTKLLIPKDATLIINATPQSPVVLTGEFPVPGYWGGIEFQGSRSAGNLLRGAVVQYAGGADTQAAINVTTAASRFRMENTLVRFNRGHALKINFIGVVIDKFQGNRISENGAVGFVALEQMKSLVGNSEYTNNDNNVFSVSSRGYTDVQITIPDLGIPISWNGVQLKRSSLTIEPGVEFSNVPASLIDVEGSFTAIGTAEKPIIMKGRLAQPGSWNGLRLSGRGDKIIKHLNISYAGNDRPDTGAIDVLCSAESKANVNIDHVDITDSESWGIFVSGDGCTTTIGENNTFLNNALGNVSVP